MFTIQLMTSILALSSRPHCSIYRRENRSFETPGSRTGQIANLLYLPAIGNIFGLAHHGNPKEIIIIPITRYLRPVFRHIRDFNPE
ncbi:hypothetical protein SAMN02745219_00264 [Desulfofundulus thermosubterraneus DSM 16057]|uniref:Uncharacterized protein n=1 Tax=Desulfofundulus thermosubterraneus DSM 16057 TaxID=1121432 RepID=A0A1M6B0D3_9FIRM|nr:hypothetical protein SAMN02745219_00264 [Desulfofundulus thermosubterraneus DSM 16057]